MSRGRARDRNVPSSAGAPASKISEQRGFSLLELIASLAIVSLVSAALFQSMAAWMRLSARASAAADASLSSIAGQQMFDRIVGGLVFAWPEEETSYFVGASDGFSGLSATPLHGIYPRLAPVRMSIIKAENSQPGRVVYQSENVEWTLRDFSGAAAFSYLGADGAWRATWPPTTNPEPGPFDDAAYFDVPQLPLAVRASFSDGDETVAWIADIAGDPKIPQRMQDLAQ